MQIEIPPIIKVLTDWEQGVVQKKNLHHSNNQ